MTEHSELVRQCQAERDAFRKGERVSPACVELFRRALADDPLAWEAVFSQLFAAMIRRWIEIAAQSYREHVGGGFGKEEVEDAIQETQLAFWRSGRVAPTLFDSGDLGPIIAYLKKCTWSAVLMVVRKLPAHHELPLTALAGEEESEASAGDERPSRKASLHAERSFTEALADLREILDELQKVLQTDEERLIAHECFINETPPREMVQDYGATLPGDTFDDKISHVNNVLQRIRRRAIQQPNFQKIRQARRKSSSSALLYSSQSVDDSVEKATMPQQESCPFDEATLLDYLRGAAPADVQVAIELSPACVDAARALAEDVVALTPYLRLALCPDIDTLLTYHEKRLPGAQQLVVHNHVHRCKQCQTEIAMFEAVDAAPLFDEPSLLRRIVEAVFAPSVMQLAPVRGSMLQFQTPQLLINLYSSKSTGKARTWTLQGLVQTADGQSFTALEAVLVSDLAAADSPPQQATIEPDGAFQLRGLAAGKYSLRLATPDEEIVIRSIEVGYEL